MAFSQVVTQQLCFLLARSQYHAFLSYSHRISLSANDDFGECQGTHRVSDRIPQFGWSPSLTLATAKHAANGVRTLRRF